MSHISYLPKFAPRVVSLLIAYVLVCSSSFAVERSFETCHQIAREAIGTTTVTLLPQGDVSSLFYVFVGSDGGYAIVSSDDRTPALLGYDKKGTLQSTDDLPAPVLSLLANYSKRVENLAEGEKIKTLDDAKSSSMLKASRITGYSIGPLLGDIEWNQNAPYNNACPVASNGQHCYTGCVATAVAQVMKYYNYPSATIEEIPSYTTGSLKIEVDGFEKGTEINWQDIRTSYKKNSYTATEADAVAHLFAMLGAALKMDYSPSESGSLLSFVTTDIPKYFGYDPDIKEAFQYEYSLEEWNELLLNELLEERPILFSAQPSYGGGESHAFICDGIDESGMFHINPGWGSGSSGYFDITLMLDFGIGGGYEKITAYIGFQPDDGIDNRPTNTITYVDWDGTELASEQVKIGSSAVGASDIPLREGYMFKGWRPLRKSTPLGYNLYTYIGDAQIFSYDGIGTIGWKWRNSGEFENGLYQLEGGANNTGYSEGLKFREVKDYAGIGCFVDVLDYGTIDLSGSEGFSFYHYGSPITVGVVTERITDNSYHRIHVDSHEYFTKVTVKWEDLKGPGWGMGDEIDFMDEELYKEVINIQWDVDTESGEFFISEIYVDGIDLLEKAKPVSLDSVTCDVIVIAQYRNNSTPLYTVSYIDWDGTPLGSEQVWENEDAVNVPNLERDGYKFVGWDKPLTNITEDVVVTAQYKKYFTVTYLELDGTLIRTEQVADGSRVMYCPYFEGETDGGTWAQLLDCASKDDIPFQVANSDCFQRFYTGRKVTEDITLIHVNYFKAEYRDWDGTFIKREDVVEGGTATGEVPSWYIFSRSGYLFIGWDKPLTNITESTVFTAQYGLPIVVTYYNWDGTKLGTRKVGEGGDATNLMTVPKRKGYRFVGWDKPLTNVTEEISVTAQYEVNTTYHTVTFIDQIGQILATELVLDGEDAKADFPIREGCRYSFNESFMNITSDLVVHVTVTGNHIVTYYDWDGTKLDTKKVGYGNDATNLITAPKRKGYRFVGWDKPLTNVTEDISVTAQYEINSSYHTVTYLDWDGMELGTEQVEDSWDAVGLSPNPQRDGYTFVGWDKSLTNITSDMSVTAQYEEKPLIFYTVTYMDWDGKILGTEQVPEGGDAVGLAEIPQRAKYSFIGWSKPLTNITSKTTLIALYQPSTNIPSLDNVEELTKPQKVFKDGEIYILLPDGRKININGAEIQE